MFIKLLGETFLALLIFRIIPVDAAHWVSKGEDSEFNRPVDEQLISFPVANTLNREAGEFSKPPVKKNLQSFGVVTSGKSVIVYDVKSGFPLFTKDADTPHAIGSISKLMTALVFMDTNPDLDSLVTIKTTDYVAGGREYLNYNDPLSLREVLQASLIGSDNIATMALARLSGLTMEEFIAKMNAKALMINAANMRFDDPVGLSAHNVSSAREVGLLLDLALKNPILAEYVKMPTVTITQGSGFTVEIQSTNELFPLLNNVEGLGLLGAKTGYIPEAGYCLATALEKDGSPIIVVVLGAPSKEDRFLDALRLASWTYDTFDF